MVEGKVVLEGEEGSGGDLSPQVGTHNISETRRAILSHSGWEFQTHSSYLR